MNFHSTPCVSYWGHAERISPPLNETTEPCCSCSHKHNWKGLSLFHLRAEKKKKLKRIFSWEMSTEISIDPAFLDDFAAPCCAILIWQCTHTMVGNHSLSHWVHNLTFHNNASPPCCITRCSLHWPIFHGIRRWNGVFFFPFFFGISQEEKTVINTPCLVLTFTLDWFGPAWLACWVSRHC